MNSAYIHALAVIVEHYMERGYTLEQALEYCLSSESEVFRVHRLVQREKKLPNAATASSLIQADSGMSAEAGAAGD